MRKLFLLLLSVITLFGISSLQAQAPPQDGTFVKICDLYGSANSGGSAWHKDEACNLPRGFKLDNSYHQSDWRCCGGGATSEIKVSDIPAGIHFEVGGGHYWSVVGPLGLKTLEEDDDGRAILRQVFLHTYCGPAGGGGPGCNVNVTIWAKRKN